MGTVISSDTSASFVGTINFSELPVDFSHQNSDKLNRSHSSLRIEERFPNSLLALPTARTATKLQKEEGAGRKEIIMSNLT